MISQKFGDGLINNTWKISDLNKKPVFILQQVNKHVFTSPDMIADNIHKISAIFNKVYSKWLS